MRGLGAVVLVALSSACGGKVVFDNSGSGGVGGAGGGAACPGSEGQACSTDPAPGEPVVAGGSYGSYTVTSIALHDAPCGAYTFEYLGPTVPTGGPTSSVRLKRDGQGVATLEYEWQTTVSDEGGGLSYTFDFPCYFAITVRNATSGTLNLWDMPQSIFDGQHVVLVP